MSEHNLHPNTQLGALESVLKQLDLTGAAAAVDGRIQQAKTEQWPFEQFLASLLSDELVHRAEAASPRRLTVSPDGRWFQVDSRPVVSLVRRTALRRLLATVLMHREHGAAVPVQQMVHAGWPRETLSESQGATRVYTAIRTLRRMGLENILLTTDRGYEIAAEVDVVQQPS